MGAVRGTDPGQRRGGPLSLWVGGRAEVHRQVEAGWCACKRGKGGRSKRWLISGAHVDGNQRIQNSPSILSLSIPPTKRRTRTTPSPQPSTQMGSSQPRKQERNCFVLSHLVPRPNTTYLLTHSRHRCFEF